MMGSDWGGIFSIRHHGNPKVELHKTRPLEAVVFFQAARLMLAAKGRDDTVN